jgi:hypothetical protein
MTVARAFKESGMFPDLRSEAQAVVKIVAGQEVGFGPMASMQAVQMIQGKPTFSANALAALVKRHPAYNYRSIEHTAEVCRLQFYEDGETAGVSEFSMEDAKAAGLLGNQVWRKYPKAMLFARALSQGVRWYAPDVTAGAAAYVPEELGGEVDGEGEVVEQAAPKPTVTAEETKQIAAEADEELNRQGPSATPTIDEERAEQIIAGIGVLKLNYRQINVLLGAAGIDALRANSAKAVRERITGLTAEQADAVEAELEVEANRNV